MARFGFITDTHFSVMRGDFRTDDYFESVVSKMRQCYRYFEDKGCGFVVHGGDFFDKYRSYSYPMLVRIRKALLPSKLPTYFIWGQHDILGYNLKSATSSNLAFLKEISDGKLIEIERETVVDGIRLVASHVDENPIERLRGIERSELPTVAVVHALLYDKPSAFDTIDIHGIGEIAPCLVLSGDLHCGYPETRLGGTVYCNPGSLARTAREARRPKGLVVDVDADGNVAMEEFYPQCEEFPFVEREEVKKAEEQDSEAYVKEFKQFRTETKDIFELLKKIGKEHDIEEDVLDYILSRKRE